MIANRSKRPTLAPTPIPALVPVDRPGLWISGEMVVAVAEDGGLGDEVMVLGVVLIGKDSLLLEGLKVRVVRSSALDELSTALVKDIEKGFSTGPSCALIVYLFDL